MESVTQSEVTGRLVRRAVLSDVPALVELRAEMFLAMGSAGVESSEWRMSAQDWFISHLDDARVCIVVAEAGQRLVSTAMAAVRDRSPPRVARPATSSSATCARWQMRADRDTVRRRLPRFWTARGRPV